MLEPKIKKQVAGAPAFSAPTDAGVHIAEKQAAQQMKSLQAAGQMISGFAEKWQEQIDTGKVAAAEAALQKRLIEWKAQAQQRQGWNANGLSRDFDKWYQEQQLSITNDMLDNDSQRRAFSELAQKVYLRGYQFAANHETREVTKATDESIDAGIEAQIMESAASPGDLQLVEEKRAEITRRVAAKAQLNGWDEKTAAVKTREYLADLHRAQVDQIVQHSAQAAQEYIKRYRSEMAPNDIVRAERIILEQQRKQEAERITKVIMASAEATISQDPAARLRYFAAQHAGNKPAMLFEDAMRKFGNDTVKAVLAMKYGEEKVREWGDEIPPDAQAYLQAVQSDFESGKPIPAPTLNDLMKATDNIQDPEVRDIVRRQIRNRYLLVEQARKTEVNNLYEQAIAALNQSNYDINAVPPHIMAGLPPSYRKRLKAYADAMGKVDPNWDVYIRLRDMADYKPEKFAQYDLREHIGELSKGQLEQLLDIQSRIRREMERGADGAGGTKGFKSSVTINQLISSWADANIDGDKEEKAKFRMFAYDQIVEREKREGRKMTAAEVTQLLREMVMPVKVDGLIFDSTMPRWKALTEGETIVSAKIPDEFRNRFVSLFRQKTGREPTAEEIKQGYYNYIYRNGGK